MHKLFVLSHLRTLARLGAPEFAPPAWEEVAARNGLAPSGDGLLYRLPREELKHTLNIHCPINNLEQPHAESIILAGKALRHHVKISEEKHCAKCPFVQQCAHAKKPYSPAENTSSLRDLLFFFHGLQHMLKPETVYYRQWVSAYRLGDSIVASIDDLAKGGLEIAEYDQVRLEGIKSFAERMALRGKDKPQGEESPAEKALANEFENVAQKVEGVSEEKPKPKQKKVADVEKAPREAEESLGRDFSFDEEAEFEPVKKFTKSSAEKEASLAGQKGYQRIDQTEGRPSKASYNKFRPEKEQIEGFEGQFERHQPKGNDRKPYDNRKPYENHKPYENRQPYDRSERSERGERGDREQRFDRQERGDRYERTDRGDSRGKFERPQWGNNERSGERDFRGPKQDRYSGEQNFNNRGNDRRYDQGYKPREQNEDFPRTREFNRNKEYKPRDQQDYKPRDQQDYKPREQQDYKPRGQQEYSGRPAAPAAKSNPFVSKWKSEEEGSEPRQAPRRPDLEPAAKPRIIEVEQINESAAGGAPRVGRRVRSRSGER